MTAKKKPSPIPKATKNKPTVLKGSIAAEKKAARQVKTQANTSRLQEDEKPYIARTLRFIDLFCGIGGFRIAFEKAGGVQIHPAGPAAEQPFLLIAVSPFADGFSK